MLRWLLPLLSCACSSLASAAYPSAQTWAAAGSIHGFSQVLDFNTGYHHCAYIDSGSGKVIYKLLGPDGTVLAGGAAEEVDDTSEPASTYAVTSVDFDSASRPVVAYTRLDSGIRSIRVARWDGSAWVIAQVASGLYSNRLSLALNNRNAAEWRLAYVNYTAPSLRLASSGGGDIKVADLEPDPVDAGVQLRYSAGSGAIVYRDPAAGGLLFANISDDGSGASALHSLSTVDASGDAGAQVAWVRGPGGRPHFAYVDLASGAVKLARRLPDFSWTSEEVLRPTFGTLANPSLWFDPQGNPVLACTDTAGDALRFAARIAGDWHEDDIDLTSLMRGPVFMTTESGGGFRLFAVTEPLSGSSHHLRMHGPVDDFSDPDGDAVPLRFERAFMMNPAVPDRDRLPAPLVFSTGGQPRCGFTVRQDQTGSHLNTAAYQTDELEVRIEVSPDLRNWSYNASLVGRSDSFTLNGVRYSTYHIQDPVGTPGGNRFLRVAVIRR